MAKGKINIKNKKLLGKAEETHFLELRKLHNFEEEDFSDWLVENLDSLSKAIGKKMELKDPKRNQQVPDSRIEIDILCKNFAVPSRKNEYVVIENQIEKSNHDHLGKLVAYAACQNATTCIWINTRFSSHHIKSLDWLNRNTSKPISFFGVEVKLFRIPGSKKPIPIFNVILRPPSMRREKTKQIEPKNKKSVVQKTDEKMLIHSGVNFYHSYWTSLMKYLEKNKFESRIPTPSRRFYQPIVSMKSGRVTLYAMVLKDRRTVDIYIRNKEIYQKLHKDKKDIEEIIEIGGDHIEWISQEDKETSRIVLNHLCDPQNNDDWENQFAWFKKKLKMFEKAFRSRIEEFNIENEGDEEEEDEDTEEYNQDDEYDGDGDDGDDSN